MGLCTSTCMDWTLLAAAFQVTEWASARVSECLLTSFASSVTLACPPKTFLCLLLVSPIESTNVERKEKERRGWGGDLWCTPPGPVLGAPFAPRVFVCNVTFPDSHCLLVLCDSYCPHWQIDLAYIISSVTEQEGLSDVCPCESQIWLPGKCKEQKVTLLRCKDLSSARYMYFTWTPCNPDSCVSFSFFVLRRGRERGRWKKESTSWDQQNNKEKREEAESQEMNEIQFIVSNWSAPRLPLQGKFDCLRGNKCDLHWTPSDWLIFHHLNTWRVNLWVGEGSRWVMAQFFVYM